MSTRWMMVQYVGDMLRLPVVNESDMGKPFGSSVLEREVKRIVVNPFSDNPQTFVLESELKDAEVKNAKLRELVRDMWHLLFDWLFKSHEVPWKELEAVHDRMRELGVEVSDA